MQPSGEFGRLDVMMCNAGYGLYGEIDRVTPEQMHAVMDVNYFGTFHAARAALPVFRKQGRGHTIIVSSIVGQRGIPFMGPYSATKFAQVGLAECLRAELAGHRPARVGRLSDLHRNRVLQRDDQELRVRDACARTAAVARACCGRDCARRFGARCPKSTRIASRRGSPCSTPSRPGSATG